MINYIIACIIFLILCLIIYCIYYHYNYLYSIEKRRSVPYEKRKYILTDIYNIIINASEATGTKPFLIYGTLLGYYRNKDLICYDYDLDFGIDKTEYNKLFNYIVNYIKKFPEYRIVNNNIFDYYNIAIVHKDTKLSADISGFTLKDNMYSRDVFKLYSKYYLHENCVYIPKSWIMPLKYVKFLNRYTYIPNIPSNLLNCYYGKNYIIPDHKCNNDCSICIKV